MAEVEIVRIPVVPEKVDPLVGALESARQGYLASPACTALEIAYSESEVIAIIHWVSSEAHQVAAQSQAAGELFAEVRKYAAGEPTIEILSATAIGQLAGQIALVTGGASGIGRAVVDAYVAAGAKVGVVDRNAAGLASVKVEHGNRVMTIHADLTTVEGNIRAVNDVVENFGKLDVLVPNAGIFDGFFDFSSVSVEQLDEGFDEIFGVNVRGLMIIARAALPHLVHSRGSIIATLSNASLYPDGGGVLYVASKHAALGVVRQLAHELAPVVRVNAVAPGATKSPIGVPEVLGGAFDQTEPEVSASIAAAVPLGVHVEPGAHAGAYVLLAARSMSSAMTGTVIESDGGLGIRGLRRTRGGDMLDEQFPGE